MNIRKIIRKRIRHQGPGTQMAADVNAAVAANVNEPGSRTRVTSRQRIVQRQQQGREQNGEAREGGDRDG